MIGPFKNKYSFLSNFQPVSITYKGFRYDTVEHAYQAAKAITEEDWEIIAKEEKTGKAKKLGNIITCRSDWDEVKLIIMKELLQKKFETVYLKQMLLDTGDEELVEINTWGDEFWGVCNGKGENHLGRLLMEVREKIRSSDGGIRQTRQT